MNGTHEDKSEPNNDKYEKARRKLSLLELAQDLKNISKACRMLGYSRQHFYEIKRNYDAFGFNGLIDKAPGAKHPHPNRIDSETEQCILSHALRNPLDGPNTVALALRNNHHPISSGGVRGVFSRHDLLHKGERISRLEAEINERRIEPTETQIAILEEFSPEFRERHINANYSGEFVAIDCFQVTTTSAGERIYAFTAIDCFSRYVIASLNHSRALDTFIDFFQNHVLPFFQAHGIRIKAILGNSTQAFLTEKHNGPFNRILRLEGIELNPLARKHQHGNGYSESLKSTLLTDCFDSEKAHSIDHLDILQNHLEEYIEHYNNEREITRGAYVGRTPYDVLRINFSSIKT